MAQPVETATDYRHTHKCLGLIIIMVCMDLCFKHANTQTANMQTNGRYQMYYLPCFAVDNNMQLSHFIQKIINIYVKQRKWEGGTGCTTLPFIDISVGHLFLK